MLGPEQFCPMANGQPNGVNPMKQLMIAAGQSSPEQSLHGIGSPNSGMPADTSTPHSSQWPGNTNGPPPPPPPQPVPPGIPKMTGTE